MKLAFSPQELYTQDIQTSRNKSAKQKLKCLTSSAFKLHLWFGEARPTAIYKLKEENVKTAIHKLKEENVLCGCYDILVSYKKLLMMKHCLSIAVNHYHQMNIFIMVTW